MISGFSASSSDCSFDQETDDDKRPESFSVQTPAARPVIYMYQ